VILDHYSSLPCLFRDPRVLLSFPTRRSSDLMLLLFVVLLIFWPLYRQSEGYIGLWLVPVLLVLKPFNSYFAWQERRLSWNNRRRSEEHTSELQSRENLVCRLLLEKKNGQT